MKIIPVTQRAARAFVTDTHRHLSAPRGDVSRVGLQDDSGTLVGVTMAGRPSARLLDDGATLEITRVAVVPGVRNGCSIMYGAIRRAARALGWRRVITYTRVDEDGASLRAAGFIRDVTTAGGEWTRPSRKRRASEQPIAKVRWVWERGGA